MFEVIAPLRCVQQQANNLRSITYSLIHSFVTFVQYYVAQYR